mgnify:CR=1 FL=1
MPPVGMSDDGEPHGTAGKPMLTTLLHSGVGEIVAVCSRWFGGVKLGTGGLSRAYSGGVKLALESLPTEERVERVRVEVVVGYAEVAALQRLVADAEALLESEEYGAGVRYVCAVPAPALEAFRRAVADDPENYMAWSNLAAVHAERGRFDESRRCLERALRIRPDFAQGWYNLALLLSRRDAPAGQIAGHLSRALELGLPSPDKENAEALLKRLPAP